MRRQTKDNKDKGNWRVENQGPEIKWTVKDGENYTETFAGKILHNRPIINGKPMCQRWNSSLYCFKDCQNKATYISSTEVGDPQKSNYNKYYRKCRGE